MDLIVDLCGVTEAGICHITNLVLPHFLLSVNDRPISEFLIQSPLRQEDRMIRMWEAAKYHHSHTHFINCKKTEIGPRYTYLNVMICGPNAKEKFILE